MISNSQAEGVGCPVNPVEQTLYPGTVVEAGDQTPPGIIGKGEVKFKHQIIQEGVRFFAVVFFLEHRCFRSQGKSLADGETDFDDIVSGKAGPARRPS
jgi:hypothetical protein